MHLTLRYPVLSRTLMVSALSMVLTLSMRAQSTDLDVDIRSAFGTKPTKQEKARGPSEAETLRNYGVLAVQEVKSIEKLVKPMDENKLMGDVFRELTNQGFHRVAKGQRPDILLTIQYGRSWVSNPYFGNNQTPNGGDTSGQRQLGPTDIAPAYNMMKAGTQAKIQKAEFEKLAIRITAWKNPKDPKSKAEKLWSTLMLVDDPDHRDLNAVSADMLAAGGPFFAHDMDEPEMTISKPLREGRVDVGTPSVVEPKSNSGK